MSINTNALQLLSIYGNSDDSEDEVPVGRVSTKRCFRDESPDRVKEHKKIKNPERLPVPSMLQKSENSCDMEHNDPSSHDGKIRSFAHERGNWATYVHVPFVNNEGVEEILALLMQSTPDIGLKEVDNYHITLSRTVILKYHWIPLFVESLQGAVSNIKRFIASFGSLKVYCNDERTRTFVGFLVQSGFDSLLKLTEGVDSCLKEFNLPTYYTDPSFHMSVAWCVGDRQQELTLLLEQLDSSINEVFANHVPSCWCVSVTEVQCKTGNKQFNAFLQ